MRGTADMTGNSELQREHNDLNRHAPPAKQQGAGQHTRFPQNPYRWRVAMARIRVARGDPHGALELLHEAQRLYMSDFFPTCVLSRH